MSQAVPTYKAVITAKQMIAPDTMLVTLKLEAPESFTFKAGQFAEIGRPDQPGSTRAYSICSAPSALPEVEFCIRLFPGGMISQYVAAKKIGDTIDVQAPFGAFTLENLDTPFQFVATGTGIAPLRSLLITLFEKKPEGQADLLFGVRDEKHMLFEQELAALAKKHKGFSYHYVLSQASETWKGLRGYVTEHIDAIQPDAQFYLCGNPQMIKDVKAKLVAHAIASSAIHVEQW
jgi:CDP-4-dehydro-6-deoxyglucose reductase